MANPNEEAVLGLEGTGSGTGEICDQREEEEEGIIKQEITEEEEVDEEELQLQQQAANIKMQLSNGIGKIITLIWTAGEQFFLGYLAGNRTTALQSNNKANELFTRQMSFL